MSKKSSFASDLEIIILSFPENLQATSLDDDSVIPLEGRHATRESLALW